MSELTDAGDSPSSDKLPHARFFAVPPGAPRDRRPTDVTMLVVTSIIVVLFATRAGSPTSGFEGSLSEVFARLPSFLNPLWHIANDALVLWALIIPIVALFRRHWGLAGDLVAVAALVICLAALVGRLTNGTWPDLIDALVGTDGPVEYPAAGLALWVGVASAASSHLSRPYRYLGRWLVIGGAFAAVALGIASPSGSLGAASLGLAAAASVHLIFGSPGGLPSIAQVRAALAGIGVDAEPLDITRQTGVVLARALAANGSNLQVKIYGRDAWDGQLVVSIWRFTWYREHGPTLALTRLQQVEHEAFLTLLAEHRGAMVNPVVAAGADAIGDALLVLRRFGRPLAEVAPNLDSASAALMWRSLRALHDAGIIHGAIDAGRIFVDGDSVRLADLINGDVEPSPSAFLVDRAQLLATTAATFGTEAAVAAALAELDAAGLAEVSSYVQPAALSVPLRRQVAEAGLDVDDIRAAAVVAAGGQERDLQRLHRLSVGRVLMGLLLFFAASALVTGLLEIGLDTIYDAISEANIWLVILAFFVALLSRPANALALSALAPVPVPLGRLTMLQLAMSFVNLAMPATAARVAVNVRFFQRSGVDPTASVAIGAIDGFTGFLGQLILIGSVLLFGLGSVDFNIDQNFSLDHLDTLLLVLVIVVIGCGVVVALVPALRRRALSALTSLRELVGPFIRSPRRVAKTLSANILAELIYATALYTVLCAFGQSVTIPDVVLVSISVSLFAGLMPIPGGIGISEAALTAGFIAIGVPDATAFAAAITCRIVTYYTPPVPGWFALRWLQRRRYL